MAGSPPVTTPEPSARQRFLPKKIGEGKKAVWGVYDLQNGSYPYQTAELGKVLQDTDEKAIITECERLTAAHGGLNEAKKRAAAAGHRTAKVSKPDPDEDDE